MIHSTEAKIEPTTVHNTHTRTKAYVLFPRPPPVRKRMDMGNTLTTSSTRRENNGPATTSSILSGFFGTTTTSNNGTTPTTTTIVVEPFGTPISLDDDSPPPTPPPPIITTVAHKEPKPTMAAVHEGDDTDAYVNNKLSTIDEELKMPIEHEPTPDNHNKHNVYIPQDDNTVYISQNDNNNNNDDKPGDYDDESSIDPQDGKEDPAQNPTTDDAFVSSLLLQPMNMYDRIKEKKVESSAETTATTPTTSISNSNSTLPPVEQNKKRGRLQNHHPSPKKKQKTNPKAKRSNHSEPQEIFSGLPDEPLPGGGGGWPEGWTKKVVKRASGESKGHTDRYWYTPITQLKLRSMVEVQKFIQALEQTNGDEVAAKKIFKSIRLVKKR